MKKLTRIVALAALAACIQTAFGQAFTVPTQGGLYNPRPQYLAGASTGALMPGGACVIPPESTNEFIAYTTGISNNVLTVTNSFAVPQALAINTPNLWMANNTEGFTNVQMTFGFTGAATSTNGLSVFESLDLGRSFNPVPIWQATAIAPGAAAYETNPVIATHGGILAFVLTSTGTAGCTNALLEANVIGTPAGMTHVIR